MTTTAKVRIFAASLLLPLALATTGCNANCARVFSTGFQAAAHQENVLLTEEPHLATVSAVPQLADRPHHHASTYKSVLIATGAHHLRNVNSLAQYGVEAQDFTPIPADTTGVTTSLNAQ